MRRWLKNRFKESLSGIFHLGQRFGFDVLPRHFYSEIPDIAKLRRTKEWRQPYSLIGVNGADVEEQLRFVQAAVSPEIYRRLEKGDVYRAACEENGEEGYGFVEANFLYAFIASHRPLKIIQVGSGVSTAVCLAAAKDANYRPKITCVDPFPTTFLKVGAEKGTIELIAKPVEMLDPTFVSDLAPRDFFFVDSSHTLGPAGEVSRIILELLPRLGAGTYVHFHDVMFPYDYPAEVLTNALFFPHESALLHAFLTCNSRFTILASLSMLHHLRLTKVQKLIPNYDARTFEDGVATGSGHFPSSIYLRVNSE
jgi:hypothetical protein